jgi:hypothetical protein
MGAKVERREALWTFGRESGQNPSNLGAKGRQTPASASKHAGIGVKLDIPSNLATILLEPTQRRQSSRGWRQMGLLAKLALGGLQEKEISWENTSKLDEVM